MQKTINVEEEKLDVRVLASFQQCDDYDVQHSIMFRRIGRGCVIMRNAISEKEILDQASDIHPHHP